MSDWSWYSGTKSGTGVVGPGAADELLLLELELEALELVAPAGVVVVVVVVAVLLAAGAGASAACTASRDRRRRDQASALRCAERGRGCVLLTKPKSKEGQNSRDGIKAGHDVPFGSECDSQSRRGTGFTLKRREERRDSQRDERRTRSESKKESENEK